MVACSAGKITELSRLVVDSVPGDKQLHFRAFLNTISFLKTSYSFYRSVV